MSDFKNLPDFDEMKSIQEETISQMKKNQRIKELAEEIQEETDSIDLMEFVNYKYGKLNTVAIDKIRSSIILEELPEQGVKEIKNIIKKQSKLASGPKMKCIELGPSFVSEPMFIENYYELEVDKYDIIVTGSSLELWCLLTIYEGQWLEEYVAFNYDPLNPNIDKKYLPKDSWDQDKYIPSTLKDKIKEIMSLMKHSRNPVHLPLHPVEMAWCISREKHFRNLSTFRIMVFKLLKLSPKFIKNEIGTEEQRFQFFRFLYFVSCLLMGAEDLLESSNGRFIPNQNIKSLAIMFKDKSNTKEISWLKIFFKFEETKEKEI